MVKSAKNKTKTKVKPVVAKAKVKAVVKAKAKPSKVVAKKVVSKAHGKPVAKAPTKLAAKLAAKVLAKTVAARSALTPVAAVKPAVVAAPAPKPVVQPAPVAKKPTFRIGELVVYPAHGVGRISNIEEQEIAGVTLELYIVDFDKEKLRLKVPTNRAEQKGMRHLADRTMIETAMKVIRGRARIKRTMWSRRAQEYDAKINSGDMIAVSEVIRDLYRSERQPEQS